MRLLSFGHGYSARALSKNLVSLGWKIRGTTRSSDNLENLDVKKEGSAIRYSQNFSQDGINANITFTVPNNELEESKKIIEEKYNELNYSNLSTDSDIAKISVVGMGMMSQSGVAEKMFTTLAKNKINIQAISTSEIKISVLIKKIYTDLAIQSLHDVYKLDKK